MKASVEEEQKVGEVEGQPPIKKIKGAEPDLKVIIGSDSSDGGDDDLHQSLVEYRHSVVLAKHSTYVDTMLNASMMESKTMEIHFSDVSPDTWKKMITFLEDPVAIRYNCSIPDALECLPFYHKYDFEKGIQLCEHILKIYLEDCPQQIQSHEPVDLDTIVAASALVHTLHMTSLLSLVQRVVKQLIRDPEQSIKLARAHFEDLAPLIADNVNHFYPNHELTKEEVLSPLFPRLVMAETMRLFYYGLAKIAVTGICISGTVPTIDGVYKRESADTWVSENAIALGEEAAEVVITLGQDDCWEIHGRQVSPEAGSRPFVAIWWMCPNSENYPFPPRHGWQAVYPIDIDSCGTPKIKYITGNSSA